MQAGASDYGIALATKYADAVLRCSMECETGYDFRKKLNYKLTQEEIDLIDTIWIRTSKI